jgi:hypothetical protein
VVASTLLPVGPRTLRYGSSDGGRTVHAEPSFSALLRAPAQVP